ncbi:MAG: hypothetical protein Tsb0010_15870 [Parvularculaceae bacterium]
MSDRDGVEFLGTDAVLHAGFAVLVIALIIWVAWGLWEQSRSKGRYDSRMRRRAYRETAVFLSFLAAGCLAVIYLSGREFAQFGFAYEPSAGMRAAWVLSGLIGLFLISQIALVANSGRARRAMRAQIDIVKGVDRYRPADAKDFSWFYALSVTAGITEEIIFRGFVFGYLSLLMPIWAAAVASLALFIGGHAYQGVSGMIRILPISIAFTILVILSGSLLQAILVHIAADLAMGVMFWLLQKKGVPDPECGA